jgi:hypothetical protein
MRKLLFLLFFGCLSANAWAQQVDTPRIDTIDFIRKTLAYYTKPKFLDSLVNRSIDTSKTQFVVFYAFDSEYFRNKALPVFVWNIAKKTMDEQVVSSENWIELSKKSETKRMLFHYNSHDSTVTISGNELISFKWVEKRDLTKMEGFRWCLVEIPIYRCNITRLDENGKIVDEQIPIEMISDAIFKYHPNTKQYEMQDFARRAERKKWFVSQFLK